MSDPNDKKFSANKSKDEDNNTRRINRDRNRLTLKRIIYYFLGALEVLFALRLVFKILGANTESVFISIIYSTTDIFLTPFDGIFKTAVTQGIETESILEPALFIAMIVYPLLAWGIVKFIDIISNGTNN